MATVQTTETKRPILFERLWQVVVFAACAWGAAHVVPGVSLDGPVRRQLLVVVVLSLFDQLSTMLSRSISRSGVPLSVGRLFRRNAGVGCFGYTALLAVTVLAGPIAWWLTSRVADAMSWPFRVEGFWPFVLAPLVTMVLTWLPVQLPRLFTEPALRPLLAGQITRVLASIGGFALLLAVGLIGFEPDAWWRTGITLVVLACLYHLPGVHVDYRAEGWPWIAVNRAMIRASTFALLLGLTLNTLLLLAAEWASPHLGVRMTIDGFWTLVTCAAVLLLLTWAVSTPPALRRMRRVLTAQNLTGPADAVFVDVRVGRHGFTLDAIAPRPPTD
ncbi:hypothetical protein [Phytomonospora endophytica]|uniref:Uncharacterized membrane protein YvlD (DUF360 family) n=1 Tax=Phytomonospora endophytica TaxID=714109 RepID=A0A841FI98_9ACTN|nr:hypothetical protein [Phytomonospora endophytica]MBB6035485.1 uncharacterized membrane protein YvlD (DUF360 family) [Phytomonospora endophytica]GIG63762.1 hypothetical protein Pen01_00570 [Phytomonospora endophytica]